MNMWEEMDDRSVGDILTSLFIMYNLYVHWPVVLINFIIVFKEISLYFFPVLSMQIMHKVVVDDEITLIDLENMVNPFYYLQLTL